MSITGQTFAAGFSGSHVNWDPSSLDTIFASDYTVAVLARTPSATNGLFGAYSDTGASSVVRSFYLSNNSGGRMFCDNDFSEGVPRIADDADGLNDNTWRWHTQDKVTGNVKIFHDYADLATLTWHHDVNGTSTNHNDNATPAVLWSTFAIYPMGFEAEDIAAIVIWDRQLTSTEKENSLTQAIADALPSNPACIILFKDETGRVRESWTPPNLDSSSQDRNLAFLFSVSENRRTNGLFWYQPNDVNKPTSVRAILYNSDGSSILADSGTVDATGFPTNAWTFVPFTSNYDLVPGQTYVADFFLTGCIRYDPDDLSLTPILSSDGIVTIPVNGSRFLNAAQAFPTSSYGGMFGMDLSFYIPADDILTSGVVESSRQFVRPRANPTFDFTIPSGNVYDTTQFFPYFA